MLKKTVKMKLCRFVSEKIRTYATYSVILIFIVAAISCNNTENSLDWF